MKQHNWLTFSLCVVINLLLTILIISPFITIRPSFKNSYLDSTKTTILIRHFWNDNTNILLGTDSEVLNYIDVEKPIDYRYQEINDKESLQVNLLNKNPFTYITQPIFQEQKSSLYILSGSFDSNKNNTFYVDDWHEYGSQTLLGQTKFFKGNGILNIIYFPSLIIFIPSIILSIFIFTRTHNRYLNDYYNETLKILNTK